MDLDITWANPSEAQNAAFVIAVKQRPHNLTEWQAAEFICLASESLWYIQAKNWMKEPPNIGPGQPIWQRACEFIVSAVDLGYNAEHKTWWWMADKPKTEIAKDMLVLMDFGLMLEQYRPSRSSSIISRLRCLY